VNSTERAPSLLARYRIAAASFVGNVSWTWKKSTPRLVSTGILQDIAILRRMGSDHAQVWFIVVPKFPTGAHWVHRMWYIGQEDDSNEQSHKGLSIRLQPSSRALTNLVCTVRRPWVQNVSIQFMCSNCKY